MNKTWKDIDTEQRTVGQIGTQVHGLSTRLPREFGTERVVSSTTGTYSWALIELNVDLNSEYIAEMLKFGMSS
jgi:hypothetical protein